MTAVEVTANVTDLSPHQQLIEAFNALKRERDALVALTDLQEKDKEELIKKLGVAQTTLAAERTKMGEMEAKLELKAVSAECQIQEVESFSKETLKDALEKNAKYSEKISDLEDNVALLIGEKETLLERTATLARRDQLQKATIAELTKEIDTLSTMIADFETQFQDLAIRSAEISFDRRDEASPSPGKKAEGDKSWQKEKKNLLDKIEELEYHCNELKAAELTLKNSFLKSLQHSKDDWMIEKRNLQQQVEDLQNEKDRIEMQVREIEQLLENDHLERYGRPFTEEDAAEVERSSSKDEPFGVKPNEVYTQ